MSSRLGCFKIKELQTVRGNGTNFGKIYFLLKDPNQHVLMSLHYKCFREGRQK